MAPYLARYGRCSGRQPTTRALQAVSLLAPQELVQTSDLWSAPRRGMCAVYPLRNVIVLKE